MKFKEALDFITGSDTKTARELELEKEIYKFKSLHNDLRIKAAEWLNERDSALLHFQDKFHQKKDELYLVTLQIEKLKSEYMPLRAYIMELNKKISSLEIENTALKGLVKNENLLQI